MIHFHVPGTPAPQGSKRYLRPGVVIEDNKRTQPWRTDVRAAAIDAIGDRKDLWEVALRVEIRFKFDRAKGHYGTGRNSHTLKESAPLHHTTTPDVDKLARAILDAMTGVVFADDKRICQLAVTKDYTTHHDRPGADITVQAL